ncbi:mitochondrial fission ELM1 family protein [Caulobacter sp.]|uniref:mitochondrial fission ELM1 family protein n=1 Tax=Caulobacter sp. TaxID=78 RepID=UPI003BABA138
MKKPAKPPVVVWAISDGRAGIEAQAVGLAEAVAREARAQDIEVQIEIKRVGWIGRIGRLPWWLNWFPRRWLTPESQISPPWPDLWIAAGRATLPLSIRARRWSGGKTFVVQIQDPRVPPQMFDLVIPPKHDRLSGDNILPITGSPHRVTAARLASEYGKFRDQLEAMPHPRVAVLLGGKSKAFDLPVERAAQMAHQIQIPLEQDGGSLLMTFSRRTPEPARALLNARLRHLPGMIWDGEGPNPYFAFLAAADYILVTEDSTNMATEAASTGKPVFILKMEGSSLKFRLFHEELERQGAARPYGGAFHGWTYEPVDETGRAAREVLARMSGQGGEEAPVAIEPVIEPPAEPAPEPAPETTVEPEPAVTPKPPRKPRAKTAATSAAAPSPKPKTSPKAAADAAAKTKPRPRAKAKPKA